WQTLFEGNFTKNLTVPGATDFYMLWIDDGSLMGAPLNATTEYVYQLTDATGTVATSGIAPNAALTVEQDNITSLMIRVMQAAFTNMVMPSGFVRPHVVHAMPLSMAGSPRLPIITVNLDYGPVMEEVPIGQGVDSLQQNTYVLTAQVRRRYSITVLALSAEEREFYRDAIIGVFSTMAPLVFGKIWDDTRFMFQAYSSQKTNDEYGPGFYFSQVMLDMVGSLNATITTNYGVIEIVDYEGDSTDYNSTTLV
ncbi:MAG: hypothetical protein ACYCS8_17585, partial [Acidithiobacillus sp.]